MKAGDQLFIAFVGHGTLQNKAGKFCLPGPDLTAAELSDWLNTVPSREIIFVDATSSGGRLPGGGQRARARGDHRHERAGGRQRDVLHGVFPAGL